MAHLNADTLVIASNLSRIQNDVESACARSGRDPASVTICAATKYVESSAMQNLWDAGVRVAAENRLQDMLSKQAVSGADFDWHFIGAIQSRKIAQIAANSSTIHSLSTASARDKLAALDLPLPRVLVQVNVSREDSKHGVMPDELDEFLAGCPFDVCGLMTMPPLAAEGEAARPWFRQLAALARDRGLAELSMGTSQDYVVAVEEGATMVRVGSVLFDPLDQ